MHPMTVARMSIEIMLTGKSPANAAADKGYILP